MFHKLIKGLAPVVALALAGGLAGCNVDVSVGEGKGVPLAELDRGGDAPREIILAGPDSVIITRGERFDVDVSGDQEAVDALRFHRDGTSLAVSRVKDAGKNIGTATVRLTIPSLTALTVAGSGSIEADHMAEGAEVTIAGSGSAKVAEIAVDSLELTIAGSGDFEAAGSAKTLDMTVAGSGSAKMAGLKADTVDITIAGSGNATFASDGTVEANIVGSGDVTVTGSATCTVSALGSGKLHCSAGTGK